MLIKTKKNQNDKYFLQKKWPNKSVNLNCADGIKPYACSMSKVVFILLGCHVDTTLINMHETPKVYAAKVRVIRQGCQSKVKAIVCTDNFQKTSHLWIPVPINYGSLLPQSKEFAGR